MKGKTELKANKTKMIIALAVCLLAVSACGETKPAAQTAEKTAQSQSQSQTQELKTTAGGDEGMIALFPEDTAEHLDLLPVQTEADEQGFTLTEDTEQEQTSESETTAAAETQAFTTTEAPAATEAQTSSAAQTEAMDYPSSEGYNVIGENGILVSYQNGHYRGIMPCFGTYSACEKWAGAVDTFAQKLPGVKVYTMVVPISSEFYTPDKFWDSGFTTSQFNKCDSIREYLTQATYVDAYSALKEHRDEDIYTRTDHHWMPLGAYYAAQKFAAAAGVDFPDISRYTRVEKDGFVGSMYTYSKDVHLTNDPETFVMYLPPNVDELTTKYYSTAFTNGYEGDLFVSRSGASYYCSFLGADNLIAHVNTNVKNGRTLVVFKQSYGNATIPFLTSGFENIYVCDMRYFDKNAIQFCKDVGATDVLCEDCVMIAAGNGGKYLEACINQ